MDRASALTGISSAFSASLGIAEKAFEVCAVDEQAKSLLKVVNLLSSQLQDAKTFRRQKSSLFTVLEKRMFDDTFKASEEAIREVAALAEPARADLEVSGGHVRLRTRLLFVLRDSAKIQVTLTRLGMASQGLNAHLTTLMSREGRTSSFLSSSGPRGGHTGELKPPPPTYEETMMLHEHRSRNLRLRASALPSEDGRSRCSSFSASSQFQLPPVSEVGSISGLDRLRSQSFNAASENLMPPEDVSELANEPSFTRGLDRTNSEPIHTHTTASFDPEEHYFENFAQASVFSIPFDAPIPVSSEPPRLKPVASSSSDPPPPTYELAGSPTAPLSSSSQPSRLPSQRQRSERWAEHAERPTPPVRLLSQRQKMERWAELSDKPMPEAIMTTAPPPTSPSKSPFTAYSPHEESSMSPPPRPSSSRSPDFSHNISPPPLRPWTASPLNPVDSSMAPPPLRLSSINPFYNRNATNSISPPPQTPSGSHPSTSSIDERPSLDSIYEPYSQAAGVHIPQAEQSRAPRNIRRPHELFFDTLSRSGSTVSLPPGQREEPNRSRQRQEELFYETLSQTGRSLSSFSLSEDSTPPPTQNPSGRGHVRSRSMKWLENQSR